MAKDRKPLTREASLNIKREFLREKHQEAEAIFNQDRFSPENVKKLTYIYEVAADYVDTFFHEYVVWSAESLKSELAKLNKPESVFDDYFTKAKAERDALKKKRLKED